MSATFYKRSLPNTCVAFNSDEGKRLFKRALETEYMESYFSLSQQFLTQSEPAFCGLGTLCMVLNALEIDPGRVWKGPWRWYDEQMLDCCRSLEDIKVNGITLSEFACLARCNGLQSEIKRAHEASKEEFREALKRSSKDPNLYMVVSYDRRTLGQTGEGHFSPIGGYNEEEDMVLVLDVARFKYPSYWVSVDLLWESLHPLDKTTMKPRGYVLLQREMKTFTSAAMSQLAVNKDSWHKLFKILTEEVFKTPLSPEYSVQDFISKIIELIPDEYDSVVYGRLGFFVNLLEQKTATTTTTTIVTENESTITTKTAITTTPPSINATAIELIVHDPETKEASVQSMVDYVKNLENLLFEISHTRLYKLVAECHSFKPKIAHLETEPLTVFSKSDGEGGCCAETEEERKRCQRTEKMEIPERRRSLKQLDSIGQESHDTSAASAANEFKWVKNVESSGSLIQLYKTKHPGRRPSSSSLSILLYPPANKVNDFAAFLTLFLHALMGYEPFLDKMISLKGHSNLKDEFRAKVLDLIDLESDQVSDSVRNEVLFLREQIAALSDFDGTEDQNH